MIHQNLSKIPVLVLCGGLGTRISRCLPINTPKALALINGIPFIDYQFIFFYKNNIRNFFYLLGHGADSIVEHLAKLKSKYPDCTFKYLIEEYPLGTGGALINCLNSINHNHFILINGDTYLECNLVNFYETFSKMLPTAMMGVVKVNSSQNHGYVDFDANNRLVDIQYQIKESGYINSGIFILNKEKLKLQKLLQGVSYSLEDDIIMPLRNDIYVYKTIDKFIDIGTESSYKAAQLLLKI